jgi:hypothetical protein
VLKIDCYESFTVNREASAILARSRRCNRKVESQTLTTVSYFRQLNASFKETDMSDTTFAPEAISTPIPLGQVIPWAIFAGLLLMIAIYFIGAEEGAMSLISGSQVHEFVHDARHLLGFPCH